MIGKQEALETLRQIIDPEMGINIVDLGLICRLDAGDNRIEVDFTLTYPGCPIGPQLQKAIMETLREAAGIEEVTAGIV